VPPRFDCPRELVWCGASGPVDWTEGNKGCGAVGGEGGSRIGGGASESFLMSGNDRKNEEEDSKDKLYYYSDKNKSDLYNGNGKQSKQSYDPYDSSNYDDSSFSDPPAPLSPAAAVLGLQMSMATPEWVVDAVDGGKKYDNDRMPYCISNSTRSKGTNDNSMNNNLSNNSSNSNNNTNSNSNSNKNKTLDNNSHRIGAKPTRGKATLHSKDKRSVKKGTPSLSSSAPPTQPLSAAAAAAALRASRQKKAKKAEGGRRREEEEEDRKKRDIEGGKANLGASSTSFPSTSSSSSSLSFILKQSKQSLLVFFNVSLDPVGVSLPPPPKDTVWRVLVDTSKDGDGGGWMEEEEEEEEEEEMCGAELLL